MKNIPQYDTDDPNFDWDTPLWDREMPLYLWDPSRRFIKTIRDYQKIPNNKNPLNSARRLWCLLRHRFWSVVTGAEIDLITKIGGGLVMPHPNGIVIHPQSEIGPNCLIFQQVTFAGKVKIGKHVDVGAGAKLIGPIEIGNHVKIGANAVVTKNVGNNKTVVGIPAREIPHKAPELD